MTAKLATQIQHQQYHIPCQKRHPWFENPLKVHLIRCDTSGDKIMLAVLGLIFRLQLIKVRRANTVRM
jgi:hypothetical protein